MKYTDRNRKNIVLASMVLWLSLVGASVALFFLASGLKENSEAVLATALDETATISPIVFDGQTNTPIQGAVVVIAETGLSYETDTSGKTELISVPIIHDSRFDDILPKQWGEVTLIIYKEGYKPYVLFYLQIFAGEDRAGPSIFMYREDDTFEEPFSIIESPNRLWVESLIEKYQVDVKN